LVIVVASAQAQEFQHLVFLARQVHANLFYVDRLCIDVDDEITGLDIDWACPESGATMAWTAERSIQLCGMAWS